MEKNNISQFSNSTVAKLFGVLPNGKEVHEYILTNRSGLEVCFINYGAAINKLRIKNSTGQCIDVVLGFDTVNDYIESYNVPSPPYFGAIIGRYAGRIANARFPIDNKEFTLDKNLGNNTLHGGKESFCRKFWEVTSLQQNADNAFITFSYTSPDGEENFPGELTVNVTYTITADNEIKISYTATTTKDTVINLTQHSYFNLDGHTADVLNQKLTVNSPTILEITEDGIPTGKYIKAADKGYDFTSPGNCPSSIDNSFALTDVTAPAAILVSEQKGLKMTVYTDQPSVHIYVGGNCFGQVPGKGGAVYHPHSGICFETQNYPDAPNHTNFPNSVLRQGDTYRQETVWKFETI